MAQQIAVLSSGRKRCRFDGNLHRKALLFLLLAGIFPLTPCAKGQFASAFVFAADPNGVAVYTRNDVTGVLTPIAGSPFPSKEVVTYIALDFKGRYLFAANYNASKISMFTINSITGALQEVANSPFASLNTNTPLFLATELTGQTLYVINFYGSSTMVSSMESFQIDTVNQALAPSQTAAVDMPGLFMGGAAHPSGKTFYGYFNDPSPSNPNAATFLVFSGSDGSFTKTSFPQGSPALCLAMDPQGLHVALGTGSSNSGGLYTYQLNGDGSLSEFSAQMSVNATPEYMTFDSLGSYLYVTQKIASSQQTSVHIYSPVLLNELTNSTLPSSFTTTVSWLTDPSAPLIFADQVYEVSPANGSLTAILGANTLVPPAIFSMTPGTQPVEGPVAQLSSTSLGFGSVTVGTASTAQSVTITNTGGQNLSVNTLAISGGNAGDFSEQDNCHVPAVLTPNQFCTVMIVFSPMAAGNRSTTLTLTENAAPPSETVALAGTGAAQAAAVTLTPGSVTFGTGNAPITEGTSTSSSVNVTNSGTTALHISSVTLSGANSNDFSISAPNCTTGAIAVNANCSIAVTFLPLAVGVRSATVTLTDDAPNSPQTIQLNGDAIPSVTVAPAAGTSSTANVTAGQQASYSLQMTPGAGYTGSVSLACSGAPQAATCQLPASMMVSNGVAAPFTVTVTTTAASGLAPLSNGPRSEWPRGYWPLLTAAITLFWLCIAFARNRENVIRLRQSAWHPAFAGAVLVCALAFSGCGGGTSGVITPPKVFTPAGTSTITITATPAAQAGKQFAPQTIQLTLTVN
jgi:hypothetical protein